MSTYRMILLPDCLKMITAEPKTILSYLLTIIFYYIFTDTKEWGLAFLKCIKKFNNKVIFFFSVSISSFVKSSNNKPPCSPAYWPQCRFFLATSPHQGVKCTMWHKTVPVVISCQWPVSLGIAGKFSAGIFILPGGCGKSFRIHETFNWVFIFFTGSCKKLYGNSFIVKKLRQPS